MIFIIYDKMDIYLNISFPKEETLPRVFMSFSHLFEIIVEFFRKSEHAMADVWRSQDNCWSQLNHLICPELFLSSGLKCCYYMSQ